MGAIFHFLIQFILPGVAAYYLSEIFDWHFGIAGAVWIYAFVFLALDSMTQTVWRGNHYEKESLTLYPFLDKIAIFLILGIPAFFIIKAKFF